VVDKEQKKFAKTGKPQAEIKEKTGNYQARE